MNVGFFISGLSLFSFSYLLCGVIQSLMAFIQKPLLQLWPKEAARRNCLCLIEQTKCLPRQYVVGWYSKVLSGLEINEGMLTIFTVVFLSASFALASAYWNSV